MYELRLNREGYLQCPKKISMKKKKSPKFGSCKEFFKEYFDYQKVAKKMNVPDTILKKIEEEVKKEFPKDKMMYELHVLRAVKSKYWQKAAK